MKIAISVAKFIILVVLLLGLVGIAMYFSGYTMYAQVGEDVIFDSGSGYTLSSTEPLRVDLGYTFDFGGEKDMSGYSVMVVPNAIAGKDFTYTLGESEMSFQATPDLTEGFIIEKEDTYFTIRSKGCLAWVLMNVYLEEMENEDIVLSHDHSGDYDNMYTIVVYSNDGEASVKIHFNNTDDAKHKTEMNTPVPIDN